MQVRSFPSRLQRAGFTIMELMVVIAIIGVLAAIVLVAGGKVRSGGKRTATQDLIRLLDTALEAYIANKDGNPSAIVEVVMNPGATQQADKKFFPVADARDADTPGMIASMALFMYQANAVPQAKVHLDTIPAKFVTRAHIRGDGSGPELPTVIDSFGNPIRYVHPSFDGVLVADAAAPPPGAAIDVETLDVPALRAGQQWGLRNVRRGFKYAAGSPPPFGADGDGGTCIGNRPYFYSVGEDGLNGFQMNGAQLVENHNLDNVYTTPPSLPSDKF